jgi:hypothetical protein
MYSFSNVATEPRPIPVFPDAVNKRKQRSKSFYQYKDYSDDEDDEGSNEDENQPEMESSSVRPETNDHFITLTLLFFSLFFFLSLFL